MNQPLAFDPKAFDRDGDKKARLAQIARRAFDCPRAGNAGLIGAETSYAARHSHGRDSSLIRMSGADVLCCERVLR